MKIRRGSRDGENSTANRLEALNSRSLTFTREYIRFRMQLHVIQSFSPRNTQAVKRP